MLKILVLDDCFIPTVMISTNTSRCLIHVISNDGSHVHCIAILRVTFELYKPSINKDFDLYLNLSRTKTFKERGLLIGCGM